jgi:membrane-associated phospholipid phosphatase
MRKILLVLLLLPVINVWSQHADINLLKYINLNRNEHLDNTFRAITNSAGPIAVGLPVVLLGTGLLKHDSLLVRNSLYLGASLLSSAIITNILKYSINRPRPFVTYPIIDKQATAGSPSFPSGHTSDAFSLATSLSLTYPRWYIIIPSYAWAVAVAYSRMDLGVHYPSDVLAGAIIGAGSAFLCYKGQQWLLRKRSTKMR